MSHYCSIYSIRKQIHGIIPIPPCSRVNNGQLRHELGKVDESRLVLICLRTFAHNFILRSYVAIAATPRRCENMQQMCLLVYS